MVEPYEWALMDWVTVVAAHGVPPRWGTAFLPEQASTPHHRMKGPRYCLLQGSDTADASTEITRTKLQARLQARQAMRAMRATQSEPNSRRTNNGLVNWTNAGNGVSPQMRLQDEQGSTPEQIGTLVFPRTAQVSGVLVRGLERAEKHFVPRARPDTDPLPRPQSYRMKPGPALPCPVLLSGVVCN